MKEKMIKNLKEIISDMSDDMIIEVISYAEYIRNKDKNINDVLSKEMIKTELNKERIRVLKAMMDLGIEFSDEILSDITQLTIEQILESKKELKDK